MSLFDGIKRLFGEGKIRISIKLEDGREGIVKVRYIGALSTIDDTDMDDIKNRIYVETGSRVIDLEILGAC